MAEVTSTSVESLIQSGEITDVAYGEKIQQMRVYLTDLKEKYVQLNVAGTNSSNPLTDELQQYIEIIEGRKVVSLDELSCLRQYLESELKNVVSDVIDLCEDDKNDKKSLNTDCSPKRKHEEDPPIVGESSMIITIRIRSAVGKIIQERFFIDDRLEALFDFGAQMGFENYVYKLVSKLPNQILSFENRNKTFRELNFSIQEIVAVEEQYLAFCEDQPSLWKILDELDELSCCSKNVTDNSSNAAITDGVFDVMASSSQQVTSTTNANDRETVSIKISPAKIDNCANNNSSIKWYRRVDQTLEWQTVVGLNADRLEKTYTEYISSGQLQNLTELYFDDFGDYVLIDFNKMIVTPVQSVDIVLYHLRRKNNQNSDIPMEWNWDGDCFDEFKLVALDRESPEFVRISAEVAKTSTVTIDKIERVENPIKYKQYQLLKQKLEVIHKDKPNFIAERQLFHGTAETNVASICSTGFNRSLSGQHGTVYGSGSYFSTSFSYSVTYGAAKIFYANVLTGMFTQGNASMRMAPDLDKARGVKYDSVVDNSRNPTMYVVFSDNHAYPGYLISYNSHRHQGTVQQFFSGVPSSSLLPPVLPAAPIVKPKKVSRAKRLQAIHLQVQSMQQQIQAQLNQFGQPSINTTSVSSTIPRQLYRASINQIVDDVASSSFSAPSVSLANNSAAVTAAAFTARGNVNGISTTLGISNIMNTQLNDQHPVDLNQGSASTASASINLDNTPNNGDNSTANSSSSVINNNT